MARVPPHDIADFAHEGFPWELFSQFLLLLNICRKNLLAYPAEHPLPEQSLTRACQAADSLFEKVNSITCAASKDTLHVAETDALPANRIFTEFGQLLSERGIVLLSLRRGLTKREIGAFAALLNRKAEEFAAQGAEKIFAEMDFQNLEAKEVDYSIFHVKEINDEPPPADNEPLPGKIWENFVAALLQDPLLLERSWDRIPSSAFPEELANYLNGLFLKPEPIPDAGIEKSVAVLLEDIGKMEAEDIPPLLLAIQKFEKFITLLNPFLRRRFHQYLLGAGRQQDAEGIKRVLQGFAAKTLFEIIDDVDQENLYASENILALLERFAQTRRSENPAGIAPLPDSSAKDKIHAMFREDISEHYGSEEYHLALHSLLNEIFPAAVVDEEITKLLDTISPQVVEMQRSRVILELFKLNDSSASKASLKEKLAESITFFLHTGNFAALVQIHKYLLSAEKKADPENIPYYRDLLAQFFSPEFMEEVIATLATWGKENLEDIRYLIRTNGNHFLNPLLDRLAEEHNRFLRSFIIDELIEIGRRESPQPYLERLGDKRWYFVRNMIIILRALGTPEVVRALRRLAAHPHPKIRKEITQTLLQYRDPLAETLLLQDIKGQDEERKLNAIALAGFSSSTEIRDNLVFFLQNKGFSHAEIEMKKMAIRSLAAMGDPLSLPALVAILRSTSFLNSRKLAALKLEIIRNMPFFSKPEALDIVNEFITARDKDLSLAAREALKKMK